jgi:hypothetical protein
VSIRADQTEPGFRYRPTKAKSFDLRGKSWLTRASPGWERKAVEKLKRKGNRLTGKEVSTLRWIEGDAVLMRRHWKARDCKTVQSEWMAVPNNYTLRVLKEKQ